MVINFLRLIEDDNSSGARANLATTTRENCLTYSRSIIVDDHHHTSLSYENRRVHSRSESISIIGRGIRGRHFDGRASTG